MTEDKSDLQKRVEELSGNSGSSQYQQPIRVGIDQQPRLRGKKSRIGCMAVVIPVIVFGIILIVLFGKSILGIFSPNDISGYFMDYTYVPETDKLWIITDGSFHYTSKNTSGGSFSIKSKGYFCKTLTYVYDAKTNSVVTKTKTEFDDLPPNYKLFYNDGKVWKICSQNSGYDAEVYVYDAKTQQELMNTENFTQKYKLLNSGLTNLRLEQHPLRLILNTKDGRNPVYFIEKDTMFMNESEANKYSYANKEMYADFGMSKDGQGNARNNVYYLKGPENEVKSVVNSSIKPDKVSKHNAGVELVEVLPDKIFIEAEKLFSNSECCIIFHQDVAGDNCKRLLSCVNSDGSIFWTKKQEELFDGLEGRKDKAFSTMFFMKSNVSAMKSGNLVIFKFKEGGLIGFDYETGKEVWRVKI